MALERRCEGCGIVTAQPGHHDAQLCYICDFYADSELRVWDFVSTLTITPQDFRQHVMMCQYGWQAALRGPYAQTQRN